jgi:hypothetical protein
MKADCFHPCQANCAVGHDPVAGDPVQPGLAPQRRAGSGLAPPDPDSLLPFSMPRPLPISHRGSPLGGPITRRYGQVAPFPRMLGAWRMSAALRRYAAAARA